MKLLAATSLVLLAVFAATAAFGAAPPLVKATPVALATVHQSYSITVKKPADVIVVKVKVPPGGSFGWHSHPSAVAVAITSGTLTLYDSGLLAEAVFSGARFRRATQPRSPRPKRRDDAGDAVRHLPWRSTRREAECAGVATRELLGVTAAADAALVWRVSDGMLDGVEVTGLGSRCWPPPLAAGRSGGQWFTSTSARRRGSIVRSSSSSRASSEVRSPKWQRSSGSSAPSSGHRFGSTLMVTMRDCRSGPRSTAERIAGAVIVSSWLAGTQRVSGPRSNELFSTTSRDGSAAIRSA